MLVCITTSGTGSRLNEYTNFTNKSLVKLGDKLAICYIIEKYPEDTRFIITLGHFGKFVKDFLELAYPEIFFTFVWIDQYEGEGSSLGYSLLCAKDLLQEPFIFHCCDTIIDTKVIFQEYNIVYVSKSNKYNTYSSINVLNDNVIKFNKKGEQNNDYIYLGIFFMKNYKEFWKNLEELYLLDKNNSSLSDVHSIIKMVDNKIEFKYKYIDKFYDTGTVESYKEAQNHFKGNYDILDKYNESLCFMKDKVIKFFHDKKVNKQRVLRAADLYPNVPKILDSRDNFMVMEHIDGILLSESQTFDILDLLKWSEKNLWLNKTINPLFVNTSYNFYYTKTIDRIKTIPFLNDEITIVNGMNTGKIYDLLNKVNFDNLCSDTFYKFHGDFILDNILKTNNGFILLDWRHEFGNELYLGDIYYDLAKLKHNSIFNHKNIKQNLFTITKNNLNVFVDLKCNYNLIKQLDDYNLFIKSREFDMNKINIFTAIIWLNMAPLYEGTLREFLFYFGKLNLYLAIQERL